MPRFVPIEELFKGRRVNQEIVVLCVRWYLSFKLSFRDWVARLAERGSGMAHTALGNIERRPELNRRYLLKNSPRPAANVRRTSFKLAYNRIQHLTCWML